MLSLTRENNGKQRLGVSELLPRAAQRLGFQSFTRTLVFVKLDLGVLPGRFQGPWTFEPVSIQDVEADEFYFDGWFRQEAALKRLRAGKRLFVFMHNGRAVYYHWAELNEVEIRWLDMRFAIPPDVVYRTFVYTVPEFRQLGFARRIGHEVSHFWKSHGFKHIFAVIDPQNHSSLLLFRQLGFKAYQVVQYRRFWFLKQYEAQNPDSGEYKKWFAVFRGPESVWRAFWGVRIVS